MDIVHQQWYKFYFTVKVTSNCNKTLCVGDASCPIKLHYVWLHFLPAYKCLHGRQTESASCIAIYSAYSGDASPEKSNHFAEMCHACLNWLYLCKFSVAINFIIFVVWFSICVVFVVVVVVLLLLFLLLLLLLTMFTVQTCIPLYSGSGLWLCPLIWTV